MAFLLLVVFLNLREGNVRSTVGGAATDNLAARIRSRRAYQGSGVQTSHQEQNDSPRSSNSSLSRRRSINL